MESVPGFIFIIILLICISRRGVRMTIEVTGGDTSLHKEIGHLFVLLFSLIN